MRAGERTLNAPACIEEIVADGHADSVAAPIHSLRKPAFIQIKKGLGHETHVPQKSFEHCPIDMRTGRGTKCIDPIARRLWHGLWRHDGRPRRPGSMSKHPPSPLLRLLTVNIHKGYNAFSRRFVLHELREAVRAVGSDLVFLQEVEGASDSVGAQSAQYEFLADRIWPEHAYGRNAVAEGQDHGNAVLSRFPVVRSRNHDVSLPGAEPRGLLHCVLALPGGLPELHVMCVHLGLTEMHRRHQLARLCETVRREVPADAPLVVAGDFNDWRSRANALLAPSGLKEVFRHTNGRHARTFPARLPLLRLDRIYVRGVAACRPLPLPRRPWNHLSDHAPLAAELTLKEQP
jgi:endonuclease/exonuclease/phosphatase family metal-dependent hydrolase